MFARMLQALATDVVVISSDGERRRLARMAGFRTRRSMRGLWKLVPAEQASRYRFRWSRFWRWLPIAQVVALLAPPLVVVAIAIVLFVLLPELRVTLSPATDVDSALIELRVDSGVKQPEVSDRKLPGEVVSREYEVEAKVTTTGTARRPGERAYGTVTFVNSREQQLIVPEGFQLLASSGARFVTEAEVRLPPNTLVGQRVGIHAVEAGLVGNVPAMGITRTVETAPPGLGVFNERPTEGGTEEVYTEAVESDFVALRDELRTTAADQARGQLLEVLPSDWNYVPDSLHVESLSESYSHGLRAATTELTGKLTAQVSALGYDNNAFSQLAGGIWASGLPVGFRPMSEPVDMTVPEYQGTDRSGALYRVGVRGRIVRELDASALAARLRGATVAEAQAALSTRDGLNGPARVEIWPSWAPRAFRLQVLQIPPE
jgi:hypothetical protein